MAGSGKGPLFAKYGELTGRMDKKKSAAAAARKTAWLARLLMKRREYYRGMSNEALAKKPRYYKIKIPAASGGVFNPKGIKKLEKKEVSA